MRSVLAGLVVALVACGGANGAYVQSDRQDDSADRGETNGRTLDFVSNRPEGDDWEIRIRGSSLWASHGDQDKIKSLPPVNMDRKETDKVWRLIDAMNLGERKKGKKDEDDGFVTLVLREPGGDNDQHEIHTVYISRDSGDEDLTNLALYLQTLIKKHHKVAAEF